MILQMIPQFLNDIGLGFINAPFIGGVLLLVGALLISEKGNIYAASVLYLIADFCWIFTAYHSNGFDIGTGMVLIGTTLGMRSFWKMHKNIYFRNLNTEKEKELDK